MRHIPDDVGGFQTVLAVYAYDLMPRFCKAAESARPINPSLPVIIISFLIILWSIELYVRKNVIFVKIYSSIKESHDAGTVGGVERLLRSGFEIPPLD